MGRKMVGISVTDTTALENHINEIRGNARAWTYEATDIQRIAEDAESRLAKMHIFAKHRPGARVIAVSSGPEARSYRNAVNGSEIALFRAHDEWRLVSYDRCKVFPCRRERIDLQISGDQHKRSVRAMLRDARATIIEREAA
jgi:hypothetical protein